MSWRLGPTAVAAVAGVLLLFVIDAVARTELGIGGESPVTASSRAPGAAAPPHSAAIERLRVRVLAEYPHDTGAYTQGLLWHEGQLYESTGIHGRSSVRRVDLESGRVEQRLDLPAVFFGEGLALVGERLFVLTWQAQTGLVLDRATFAELDRFSYTGEGWGLCADTDTGSRSGSHERLIMSNGSDQLVFRDPDGFKDLGGVAVTKDGRPLGRLNELECVSGEVWANVYGEDWIARIDPASGRVTALVDASGLLSADERERVDVLNGIAYRPDHDSFLITGKLWPRLFEVVFEPVETSAE